MTMGRVVLGESFAEQLEQESKATRKMLERLPEERFAWKPHEKSMPMVSLAVHIVEMIEWARLAVTTSELDYGVRPYQPFEPKSIADLLEYFDRTVAGAIEALKNTTDEAIRETWTVRNGDHIFFVKPRIQVIVAYSFNHFIHHRGQLSVYMRLNDIPLPGVYGPTADEQVN
jgi:uncharacterized damage-inducible protein DinB